MNFGIDDSDLGNIGVVTENPVSIEKDTVESVLSVLGTGLGIDPAKNHTGICIYREGRVERYGFKINNYDTTDYFADYRMRSDFKSKLKEIIQGMEFNYCIIEGVYAGENYDTVRKLLAVNTVIDELIFEGVVKVNNFYRWMEPRWLKYFKRLYKCRKGLKSKVATQEILEYLGDSFYLENKDSKNKARIFFEDKCDATAMLCGLAVFVASGEVDEFKERKITMKDIQMYYLESSYDYLSLSDDRVYDEWITVDGEFRNLEKKILDEIKDHPNDLLCMDLPVSKLGRFGKEHNFTFYPSGEGVLIWYLKQ